MIIKPEGIQKAIAGEVLTQFVNSPLKLAGLKLVKPSEKLAKKHYKL